MIKKILFPSFFVLFCTVILALSIRGIPGNPTSQTMNEDQWKDSGPFELSPERGRYSLLYSIIEDKSFIFSLPVARFAAPDVAYKDGNYMSLFAPGISFLVIPGYLIGKIFNLAQVGAFAIIAVFAIINTLLIRAIARYLGAKEIPAIIGGLVFLFATPAFAYAVSLYQHHVSTFLILFSVYALLRFRVVIALPVVWLLYAASVVIDYPNLFMMFPIGVAALWKTFDLIQKKRTITFSLHTIHIVSIFVVIIPMVFFFWFNQSSYGNPFQLSGTLEAARTIGEDGKPVVDASQEKNAFKRRNELTQQKIITTGFFKTRNLLNGFYIHFVSPDRGMILFAPVMIFGIIGILEAYKRRISHVPLLLSIIGFNILLYSMWGDPYGGWGFGSRYLIPAYSLFGIFVALCITFWKRNTVLLCIFFVIMTISVSVNTLGAITSNRNPPKIETLALEQLSGREEKYTFMRNVQYLNSNTSKSYIYQVFAHNTLTAWQYYFILTGFILTPVLLSMIYFAYTERRMGNGSDAS